MKAKRHKGPDVFGPVKDDWVVKSRKIARDLLRTRQTITSEDITLRNPLPSYLHPNTIGRIFRDQPEFEAVGYTIARRPSSHGRPIRLWALKNPTEPPRRVHVRGEYDNGD